MKINTKISAIYLTTIGLPFTSLFAINSYISLSIVAFSVGFLMLVLNKNRYKFLRNDRPSKLICFIVLGAIPLPIFSIITSFYIHSEIRTAHIISRMLFYILVLMAMVYMNELGKCGNKKVMKILAITYLIILLVCTTDALILFGILDINLPRPTVDELVISYGNIFRIRGPFEEPGYLAAFIAATLPMYLHVCKYKIYSFIVISGIAIFMSLSANYVIWSLLYSVLWFFMSLRYLKLTRLHVVKNIIPFLIFLSFILLALYGFDVLDIVTGKFLGSSYESRIESYAILNKYFDYPENFLFGLGPGFYLNTEYSQPTSIVISTFLELGVLGILIFFGIYFINIYFLLKSNLAMHLAIGCVLYFLFMLTTPGYYYPFYVLPLLYWTFFKSSISVSSNSIQ